MIIEKQRNSEFGTVVSDFDPVSATAGDLADLASQIYASKIAVLKNQRLSIDEFVELGKRFGEPVAYYEPIYHHPDNPLVFVSSYQPATGKQIGVPRTGKFWHSDYQFMDKPFGLTMIYPQVVPEHHRGTYFIDLGAAYRALAPELRAAVAGLQAVHTPRRFFKIRPDDVYRPVGELLAEIETNTPAVVQNAVIEHPVTGESVLYISEGFTAGLRDTAGRDLDGELLETLLTATGQRDDSFTHPNIHLQTFEVGDLLIWDNRSLVHRALHTTTPEPAESFRVTVYDEYPFDASDRR